MPQRPLRHAGAHSRGYGGPLPGVGTRDPVSLGTDTYVRLKNQGSGEPSIRMGGATFSAPQGFLCSDPGPLLLPQG